MASSRFAVRSVAIIGAGSSGLAAAKYIQAQGVYDRVVVYERRSEVGGIWNYTSQPTDQNPVPQESPYFPPDEPLQPKPGNGHQGPAAPEFPTAAYDVLYVNIPHPLMGFTDLPIADVYKAAHPDKPLLIYPQRQTIEEYLISYSQEVRHLIRFTTKVDDVRLLRRPRRIPQQTNGIQRGATAGLDRHNADAADEYVDGWEVHATNTVDSSQSVEIFDAVIVAQGHYDITFVPAIANMEAFNKAHPGILTHSKRYRKAELYTDKKVIVVGNAASGLDIASQISVVSQRPLYISVRSSDPDVIDRVVGAEEVPEIAEFLVEERGVRLINGQVIRDVDAVVFCTGYLFSLPFLEKTRPPEGGETPAGLNPMLTTGRRIHGLYDDLLHIDHPTLAFSCIPMKVIPFPLAQAQAAYLSRVWANTLALPSKGEMEAWEQEAERVRGPAFHVWGSGDDSNYINTTYKRIMDGDNPASRAGKEPPRWDDRLVWMRPLTAKGKAQFMLTGCTATTLEELGFVFDPTAKGDAVSARKGLPKERSKPSDSQ